MSSNVIHNMLITLTCWCAYKNVTGVRSCYDEGKRVAETLMFDYHRQHGIGKSPLVH